MKRATGLRDAGAAALIVLAATVAWWPAFHGGFVWDDHDLILDSLLIRGPLRDLWLARNVTDYWPLTWTTFWLEWRLWGSTAGPYHAVNVALHVVAALVLWRLLRALRIPGAALAGLLFAVHPVAVESVAWISERKNVLSGVLFFGSLLAWARFDENDRRRDAAASFGLYALALLAKASVVTLPAVQLGIALWRRGRLSRQDVVRVVPFALLSAFFALVTIWFQGFRVIRGEIAERGLVERLGGVSWALLSYAQKAFVPFDLALVYPRWPLDPRSAAWWVPTLVVAAAVAAIATLGGRAWVRPVAFALGYHAVMVLPVLGLLDMAFFAVAPVSNHLQYLALAAPCALAAAGVAALHVRHPAMAVATGVGLTAALGAWTFHRATAFENDVRLWEAATRASPRSLYAATSLAGELATQVSVEAAVKALMDFERRSGDEADRRRARAAALVFLRRPSEAVSEALVAESLRPDVQRQIEIGRFLVTSGFPTEAIQLLSVQASRSSRSADVRYWLAAALWRTGRREEALGVIADGLRISPGDAKLRHASTSLPGERPGQSPPGGPRP